MSPQAFNGLWAVMFPNQLALNQVAPTALPDSGEFKFGGQQFHAVDVDHSDTHASSFLHVPSLKLVIGGDIVYGDCHQHLGEAKTKEKRQAWIDALDKAASLEPGIVVPGHKRASQADGPYLIESTKKYIRDFEEELQKATNADEFESAMKKRYPHRWNEYALSASCKASFAEK